MAEPNILLTRIDNRLIHGQVATQWNSTLGANLILVANDDVAGNKMRQNLMNMAAPTGVATRFFSLQKTIDVIHKASPKQHIFLVAENPSDVLTLVKGLHRHVYRGYRSVQLLGVSLSAHRHRRRHRFDPWRPQHRSSRGWYLSAHDHRQHADWWRTAA